MRDGSHQIPWTTERHVARKQIFPPLRGSRSRSVADNEYLRLRNDKPLFDRPKPFSAAAPFGHEPPHPALLAVMTGVSMDGTWAYSEVRDKMSSG